MRLLRYGHSDAIPENVRTAWGARLIAPNDLLHDRQDLKYDDEKAKADLIAWLDGSPAGTGAIAKLRERLAGDLRYTMPDGEDFVAYGDERGIVKANTKRSGGYVYVAAWLHPLCPHCGIAPADAHGFACDYCRGYAHRPEVTA